MNKQEALLEALRQHDDGLLMSSEREWIRGMVLKTFNSLVREDEESLNNKFMDAAGKWAKFHKEITKRMVEKFIFSSDYDGFKDVQVFFDWLNKKGK